MKSALKKLVASLESNLKAIVAIGASIAAIGGALGAGFNWVVEQINYSSIQQINDLSVQIAVLREQSEEGDNQIQQSSSRTELLLLIYHSPQNAAEIERVARHYFCQLRGDWYMSSVYSTWANENGGDISIVTSCDPHK